MSKKKKFGKVTPVIETKNEPIIPGSVGEFIELLQQFPSDGKFTLNGSVDIDSEKINNDSQGVTIYPRENPDMNNEVCNCEECDCDESSYENDVMKEYLYGATKDGIKLADFVKHMSSDDLINAPLMVPNKNELDYELTQLHPMQGIAIDEIRQHNAYVAECLSEMHRRELMALLEYNTQCLAHFGVETNKTMCNIVSSAIDD